MWGRRSTTSTRFPSWVATRSAMVRPKNPEPTTRRSKREVIGCLGYLTERAQPIWRGHGFGVCPGEAGLLPISYPRSQSGRQLPHDSISTLWSQQSHSYHRLCVLHVRSGRAGSAEKRTVQIEETSVPNRRRRKLSTAMSAVAALAVASPCAYFLVYESTSDGKPAEHHEFKQAAVMTDLPNEL